MDETASASDSPFIQGRNARLYGKAPSECPYPEDSEERAAWMQAFKEAGKPEGEIGSQERNDNTRG
jgi:ribosome modulation factor